MKIEIDARDLGIGWTRFKQNGKTIHCILLMINGSPHVCSVFGIYADEWILQIDGPSVNGQSVGLRSLEAAQEAAIRIALQNP